MSDLPPAGWYRDPEGRASDRYWDGTAWTEHYHDEQPSGGEGGGSGAPGTAPAGPPAGWYPDSQAPGHERYWDGLAWTDQRRAAGTEVATGTGQAGDWEQAPPQRKRRGVLVAGVAVVAVLLAGVVGVGSGLLAFGGGGRGGAESPIAAAEELVAALDSERLLDAARLVAPDEIDWARPVIEEVSDRLPVAGRSVADSLVIDATFGQPVRLAEGIEAVPFETVTVEALGGTLSDLLGLVAGDRETEDLRGQDTVLITVERDGRWYVSPLGTLLEAAAREQGFSATAPLSDRNGARSPEQAAEQVAVHFVSGQLTPFAHLLDPEELQVLDHYHDFIEHEAARTWRDPGLRAVTEAQGSSVVLRAIEDVESPERLDFGDWCFHQPGFTPDCAADGLRWEAEPWVSTPLLTLLQPTPADIRIATVERDGLHYVSLAGTVVETVLPALDRLSDHALAGLLQASQWSPEAVAVRGTVGESVSLTLHEGWNVVTFDEQPGTTLTACTADGTRLLAGEAVAGHEVLVHRVGDRYEEGLPARGLLVGLYGALPSVSATVEFQLGDLFRGC